MVTSFVAKFVTAGSSEQIGRAAKKFALIGIAGELATGLGVTPGRRVRHRRPRVWAFERWLETRGGTGSHEERQAIEQVRLIIEKHGEARFECADGGPNRPVRDRLGWRKGEGEERVWWVSRRLGRRKSVQGWTPSSSRKRWRSEGCCDGRMGRT